MFCTRCGKQTNGAEEICADCRAAEFAARSAEANEIGKPNAGMLYFGKGLASIIMGFGVFIVSNVLNGSGARMNFVAMIFMMIIDIAAIVLAISFGAMAIHKYSTFKTGIGKKPTPAFILGIIGVILAGIAAVIVFVFLFVGFPDIVSTLEYI